MRKAFIAGTIALALLGNAIGQTNADTGTLTNVAIDREAELYTANLDGLPIAAQPSQGASQPLPVLENGEVSVTTRATATESGEFTQCLIDQGCTDWSYWLTGSTHHVMLPIIRR